MFNKIHIDIPSFFGKKANERYKFEKIFILLFQIQKKLKIKKLFLVI